MTKIAYFDCSAGAAGDMILAALIDAGAPLPLIEAGLETILEISGEWGLSTERVWKGSGRIAATKVCVSSAHNHTPLPPPGHNDHGLLHAVFACLARAEARAHGTTADKAWIFSPLALTPVHFHEVGAIDSLIDTVGSVLALELLDVDEVHCSPLPYSNGFVRCAHGLMPVPVPATLDLMAGVPVVPAPVGATGELVTPTGMSLMKALATSFGAPPAFLPQTHGSGAGTKDFPGHANIVRVVIGDRTPAMAGVVDSAAETVHVLETNLDDMNPQILSHVQELLFEQGALDVWWQPIQMKKNRPGVLLSVLCEPKDIGELSRTLFCETTTLGIRRRVMERTILKRDFITIESPYGRASVKVASPTLSPLIARVLQIGYVNGTAVNVQPEYEDCKKLALAAKAPLKTVIADVQALARASLAKDAPMA
ncbi:hypothetical protein ACHHYP_07496 [Achlya hypogyna]|uniref:Nickel insertion protein n=1 Tax=Achlya hypogyna TaxID=1202772 RepID=A0A1V9ZLZ8_ACHHY|nr:hypothetical protein ACHHYP_07496 [Achlya hypogyna]